MESNFTEEQKRMTLDVLVLELREKRKALADARETIEDLATKNLQMRVHTRRMLDDMDSMSSTAAKLEERISTALALIKKMERDVVWQQHAADLLTIRAVLTEQTDISDLLAG